MLDRLRLRVADGVEGLFDILPAVALRAQL